MDETKTIFEEFVGRLFAIEREQKLLSEDRKDLVAEFKDKLEVKEVMAAIRIAKIKVKINSSDEEIENMVNVVKRNITV
ncbi:hypothetical protein CL634_07160 [bacterium]|jgi:uncharacterized protein (UPF0335 family)|nr:hypothetical protein [bacterium]|tara:strand:- start:166 stop:402 length:237 start_codon:yes stop_codon:yes gene_type:complete